MRSPSTVQNCPQCGAVVEGAAISATCVFCETPLIRSALVTDAVQAPAPSRLAPFRLTRQQAQDRLQRYLQGRRFLPKKLRAATQADSLHAVMVPFYAFNGVVHTAIQSDIGVVYTTGSGDSRRSHTEWFPGFDHQHVLVWHDHLVSASRGVQEVFANRLEPFDLEQALPYDPHLLAGLEVEHASISPEEAEEVARKELRSVIRKQINREMFAGLRTRRMKQHSDIQLETTESILLPIWIATYPGPKGPVSLLVNGQTGRVVGSVPSETWRLLLWIAVILVLLFVLLAVAGVSLLALFALLEGM